MVREVETLKVKLRESGIERSKMKELLLRLLYVEMLGHDASFGYVSRWRQPLRLVSAVLTSARGVCGRYIHAVKMCNEQQLMLKKVGYLTTALVLDEDHELIILIINTLQQDLRSDNHLVGVSSALHLPCARASGEPRPRGLHTAYMHKAYMHTAYMQQRGWRVAMGARLECGHCATMQKKLRIVTLGISGGRSLTGPLRDARRFPSTRWYPVPGATRTTLGFGICPSFKDHSLSRRAQP